jgi:hypothetical protein
MSLEFKTFLVNSYGASSSVRVKEAVGADVFRIDVSGRTDEESPSFPIYVAITGLDRFILDLPMNDGIEQVVRSKGGEMSAMDFGPRVSVTLETTDFEFVLQLSSIIRERMALGHEDSGSHGESVETHIAESLSYFAGLLKQYSVQTRGIEKTRPDGLFAS